MEAAEHALWDQPNIGSESKNKGSQILMMTITYRST
jgi:hypothetical protein